MAVDPFLAPIANRRELTNDLSSGFPRNKVLGCCRRGQTRWGRFHRSDSRALSKSVL